ncbi:MAG: retropepsin-like aspartic protease [Candidatus Limnocylindria bacterium]
MQILLEEPITFDVGSGEPRAQTHAPMVEARVEGAITRLILDTGSTDHILRTALAEQVGLVAEPGEAGTDSSGASVPSWRLPQVSVQIGARRFAFVDVVAIDGPPQFADWGIGGIVSPQHLHPSATAILDLVGNRFFLVDGPWTDISAWLRTRHPDMHALELDPVDGDGTVLIRAAVEPFDPVVTMLDTGARGTYFGAAAVPGLEGGARLSAGRGVGGTESFGHEAPDRVLLAGDARLNLRRLLVRPEMGDPAGPAAGLVGMDVLRGTVLAVSADSTHPILWLLAAPES